jgi:hypothetical protein
LRRPPPDRRWKRAFDEPIPLPSGRRLLTLKDAGRYITKLPKADHDAPEWLAAMEALILVATMGGPTLFAEGIEPERRTGLYRSEGAQLGAPEAQARLVS